MLAHVSTCCQVPDCVVQTLRQQVGQNEEVAIKRQKTSDLDVATRDPTARPETGRGAGPVQATVSGLFAAQIGAKEAADRAVAKLFNNNNNSLIYIAPYAELRRRWTTVNQAAVNKNVFRCFLKTESELQSRMFDGRLFQITGAE